MNKTLIIFCLLISVLGYSQEYHIDNNNINAVKLYKVNRAEQADINVFFVKNKYQVTDNGLWLIGDRTPTSKAARYVHVPEQADIKFYRVNIREQAGKRDY